MIMILFLMSYIYFCNTRSLQRQLQQEADEQDLSKGRKGWLQQLHAPGEFICLHQ